MSHWLPETSDGESISATEDSMIKMLNVFYIKGSLQQMTLYTESPKRPHPKWLEQVNSVKLQDKETIHKNPKI